MSIPVRNIYFLLLYAWKHVQSAELTRLDKLPYTDLQDLLGHVLTDHVGRLLARGLARDYVALEEKVSGVRGKMDFSATLKRNLLAEGSTICQIDDLRHDILRNRIIKATLRALLYLPKLDATVRERIRLLFRKLDLVTDMKLTSQTFRIVQSHRHVGAYDLIVRLCRLIFESVVLDENTGEARFHDFRDDEARMGALFEDFVFNFYRLEQSPATVSRPHIDWFEAEGTEHDLARLPVMRTDVVLHYENSTIILDAKFYKQALREHRGGERLHSAHLYQLFAYLENLAAASPHQRYTGMLLYPVVEKPFAFSYRLKGHPVAIRSIDLAQPWQRIHHDMLRIVGDEQSRLTLSVREASSSTGDHHTYPLSVFA